MLDVLLAIIAVVAVFAVLIIGHELGHFISARAFGIRVDEFGLGYPPRLWGIKRGQTLYSLNVLPVGGFVKIAGQEDPEEPDGLAGKGVGARLVVLSAGVIVNALLPIIFFAIAFMIPVDVSVGQVLVEDVAANSPAAIAGIQAGDTILTINGKEVRNTGELGRNIQLKLGQEVDVLIEHGDQTTEEVAALARWQPPAGEGAIGVTVTTTDITIVSESEPFWRAIPKGFQQLGETFVLFKNAIIGLFIGTSSFEVGGPVAIAQLTGEFAQAGPGPLLQFAGFLSINFAILNILPLPALDGGRAVFVLLEWVRRGKRISAKREGMVHLIGFALLMAFIVAVTYQDIIRIISGDSLGP
jgi:regulator of sigma E protease